MRTSQYSLAGAAFASRYLVPRCWSCGVLTVLGGYIDGSNLHDDTDVICVAGCAARTDAWEAWEAGWSALLAHCGVRRWHHVDFMFKGGEFDNIGEADWLIARRLLCESFAALKPTCFGYTVRRADYLAVREKFPEMPEDPYYFLLDRALHRLIQGLFEHPSDEGVLIYCDQDKNKELVLQLAQWHDAYLRTDTKARETDRQRDVVTSYGSNVKFLPLQAADVVAYELMQYARRNADKPFISSPTGSWILDRLVAASPWLVLCQQRNLLEMELTGRAFVPGHWPGYRFVRPRDEA